LGIPAYDLADLSRATAVPSAAAGSPLRELCHDLIEPTATIRWLVRAAGTESGQDLRNRLGAIAVAAAQIAAMCDDILDRPPPRAGFRLDRSRKGRDVAIRLWQTEILYHLQSTRLG